MPGLPRVCPGAGHLVAQVAQQLPQLVAGEQEREHQHVGLLVPVGAVGLEQPGDPKPRFLGYSVSNGGPLKFTLRAGIARVAPSATIACSPMWQDVVARRFRLR